MRHHNILFSTNFVRATWPVTQRKLRFFTCTYALLCVTTCTSLCHLFACIQPISSLCVVEIEIKILFNLTARKNIHKGLNGRLSIRTRCGPLDRFFRGALKNSYEIGGPLSKFLSKIVKKGLILKDFAIFRSILGGPGGRGGPQGRAWSGLTSKFYFFWKGIKKHLFLLSLDGSYTVFLSIYKFLGLCRIDKVLKMTKNYSEEILWTLVYQNPPNKRPKPKIFIISMI